MICPRCENANENEKHWLFSCVSSQNLAIYVLNILEFVYWTDGNFDNTVEDILTLPLLHLEKFPISRDLLETYFITIRFLRKEATYGNKKTREEELQFFKEKLSERLIFLYKKAVLEKKEQELAENWKNLITDQGKLHLPQGSVLRH